MSGLLKSIKIGMKYSDVTMKLKMSKNKYSEYPLIMEDDEVKAIDVIINGERITLIFDKNNNFSDWS